MGWRGLGNAVGGLNAIARAWSSTSGSPNKVSVWEVPIHLRERPRVDSLMLLRECPLYQYSSISYTDRAFSRSPKSGRGAHPDFLPWCPSKRGDILMILREDAAIPINPSFVY